MGGGFLNAVREMLVFGRLRRFIQRNFGRIAVGAIAIPVFMRITGYAANRYLTYQSMRTHEMLRRYKKQRMFEMMEENFESNFKKWYELMKETIKQTLDAEKHMELLKNGSGRKLENWMEMKIIAFSSILALIYGSSMLSVILRIQLNVISGLLFKQMEQIPPGLEDIRGGGDAAISIANYPVITEHIQQEYMVLTRYLCTDGVKSLCELMLNKARHVIENLSLKQKLTVADIEQLLVDVRNKELRYAPIRLDLDGSEDQVPNDWCPVTEAWYFMLSVKLTKKYLYPAAYAPSILTDLKGDVTMRQLIGEAFDLVNSEDAKNLLKFLEIQGLNNYLDRITEFLSTLPPDSDSSQASEESLFHGGTDSSSSFAAETSAPVAKLIPVMNSFVNIPFAEDTWATLLVNNETLKTYSANIYESYSAKEFD